MRNNTRTKKNSFPVKKIIMKRPFRRTETTKRIRLSQNVKIRNKTRYIEYHKATFLNQNK